MRSRSRPRRSRRPCASSIALGRERREPAVPDGSATQADRHPVTRRDLQVAGPFRLDNPAQDPVDRLGGRRGIVEDRRVDGHLAVDLQLALECLDDVVEVQLRPSQRDLGTTADDQERRLLRVSTCDGIERVQGLPGP